MPTFKLNKLVRDKLVEEMKAKGQKPEVTVLSGASYQQALKEKLIEEFQEISVGNAKDDVVGELADVYEALDCLMISLGVSAEAVAAKREKKNAKVGSFRSGDYVGDLELKDDDEWVDYYRQEPDRFPES